MGSHQSSVSWHRQAHGIAIIRQHPVDAAIAKTIRFHKSYITIKINNPQCQDSAARCVLNH